MKLSLSILAIILLVPALLLAQATSPLQRGSWALGGNMFFQNQSGDAYGGSGNSLTTVQLSPNVGYFISPNMAIGGVLQLSRMSQGGNAITHFAIGPEFNYYINSAKDRTQFAGSFVPYVGAFFTIGKLSETHYSSITTTSFGGQLGGLVFLSNSVAFDLAAQVSSDHYSASGAGVSGLTMVVGGGIQAFVF